MHVNVCVCVVVIVLVLVQQSRGGQGREGRGDARGRQDQAAHAAWYTLSLPTYRARMTPAGVCVRADEARGPGAGCVQACRRVGVCACGRGQSGEARNRPAQRQMRDETTRRHETGCWPGDASFGRQDATKTSQQPRPIPPPPPPPWPLPVSQQQPAHDDAAATATASASAFAPATPTAAQRQATSGRWGQEGSAQCRHVLSLGRAVGHVIF
jgi:hypothetical protein